MTRYVIIGAGAVGGALGGLLATVGTPVVLVARGDHLAAMQRRGLRLRTPDADRTVEVSAVGSVEEVRLGPADVLVAATKTQQLEGVVAQWADRPVFEGDREVGDAGSLLPFLTASNGVAAERIAARYFRRVYGVCIWLPAARMVPAEVVIRATPIAGVLHVGRVPGSATTATDHRLLAQVAADWTRAGFRVPLPDDVMPWKYRKLISNLGNVFEALLGPDADADVWLQRADHEARMILDAAGIEVTSDEDEAAARAEGFRIAAVPGIDDHLGGSTWQSLTRGTGDIETDYLNGEIALIAHEHGSAAPINAALARLGRAAARSGARPGELSVDALEAALTTDHGVAGSLPS